MTCFNEVGIVNFFNPKWNAYIGPNYTRDFVNIVELDLEKLIREKILAYTFQPIL